MRAFRTSSFVLWTRIRGGFGSLLKTCRRKKYGLEEGFRGAGWGGAELILDLDLARKEIRIRIALSMFEQTEDSSEIKAAEFLCQSKLRHPERAMFSRLEVVAFLFGFGGVGKSSRILATSCFCLRGSTPKLPFNSSNI